VWAETEVLGMKQRLAFLHPRRAVLGVTAVLAAVSVACGAPPVPGVSTDFSITRASDGHVLRWNPCAVIHWRLDSRIEPGAFTSVNTAINTLASGTGMSFVYDGTAVYIPQMGGWDQPSPLIVSFARHSGLALGSNYLTGAGQIGEGGWTAAGTTQANIRIVKGYAVIDTDLYNRSATNVRAATLVHELGHSVGLKHAVYNSEVMYPALTGVSPTYYSAGDLSGLRAVGRPAGCI